MKINHEETKKTKKDQKNRRRKVSSWLIFRGVIHVAVSDAQNSLGQPA
ncbi:MAG TPA: hypothetical protein VKE70_03520 [Candidatus Solibacter sp.]|nr:hypothetical protein [Candidatus Solibacter sp.]